MFSSNESDDEIVYDFFAKALGISIIPKPEEEEKPKNVWETSAALSLLILFISNTALLGFFIWIFSV
jgi:hypothetical protein